MCIKGSEDEYLRTNLKINNSKWVENYSIYLKLCKTQYIYFKNFALFYFKLIGISQIIYSNFIFHVLVVFKKSNNLGLT